MIQMINDDKVRILFKKLKNDGDMSARSEIIEQYLYLADAITKKYSDRGVEYDDLYQVACVGLINAVDRYDISKNIKFSTFAVPTILGEIKRYFRDKGFLIRMPRRIYEVFRKANRVKQLMEQNGDDVTVAELAKKINYPEKDVYDALNIYAAINAKSLDRAVCTNENIPLKNVIGMDNDDFLIVENRDFLCYILRNLSAGEKKLLTDRFYKNKSQKQIAEENGISQMTVSRNEKKLLEKIKKLYID